MGAASGRLVARRGGADRERPGQRGGDARRGRSGPGALRHRPVMAEAAGVRARRCRGRWKDHRSLSARDAGHHRQRARRGARASGAGGRNPRAVGPARGGTRPPAAQPVRRSADGSHGRGRRRRGGAGRHCGARRPGPGSLAPVPAAAALGRHLPGADPRRRVEVSRPPGRKCRDDPGRHAGRQRDRGRDRVARRRGQTRDPHRGRRADPPAGRHREHRVRDGRRRGGTTGRGRRRPRAGGWSVAAGACSPATSWRWPTTGSW